MSPIPKPLHKHDFDVPRDMQFINAMMAYGIAPPEPIFYDTSEFVKFDTTKKGKKAGWYIAHIVDDVAFGIFGDFVTMGDEKKTWIESTYYEQTTEEREDIERRVEEKRKQILEKLKAENAGKTKKARDLWKKAASLKKTKQSHPYLDKKQIQSHGLRVTKDGWLLIPLYNADAELCALQRITTEKKRNMASPKGLFYIAGQSMLRPADKSKNRLYVAEGPATAISVFEATDIPCACTFGTSNMTASIAELRKVFGAEYEFCVVVDNDEAGRKAADKVQKIAETNKEHLTLQYIPSIADDPKKTDANDYACEYGKPALRKLLLADDAPWLIDANDFADEEISVTWAIKGWMQESSLMMLHGPSGVGKTFVVLDMALHIAAGFDKWFGNTVKAGSIVYLAGEGHIGLRARIKAWKINKGVDRVNMWVSRHGTDLDTVAGYMTTADALRSLPSTPKIVIVDTLHRFLDGDENKSTDVKKMLDSCSKLIEEFGCSVLLVHHTGVSAEAQGRGRGSSAWKGALDIEISVQPASDDKIKIEQKKSKDAELSEPIYIELESQVLPGRFDEDGEAITSAVIVGTDEPTAGRKTTKVDEKLNSLYLAWERSGFEKIDDAPYISKSAFKEFLLENDYCKTEKSAEQYAKISGNFLKSLHLAGLIEKAEYGLKISNNDVTSHWNLKSQNQRRNARNVT